MTISTRDLSGLPAPDALEALSKSLALLDAILCPEWEFRYYSFDAVWGDGLRLASMRNGMGDQTFCLFGAQGAVLKGFAHESVMSPFRRDPPRPWPGVLEKIPPHLRAWIEDPAIILEEITFCVWHEAGAIGWSRGPVEFPEGPDPDGSAELLEIFDGRPETYHAWAQEYYVRPVDLAAVSHIYQLRPLTPAVVAALNPQLALADLRPDLAEISYPGGPQI